jgi:hypothetical protein
VFFDRSTLPIVQHCSEDISLPRINREDINRLIDGDDEAHWEETRTYRMRPAPRKERNDLPLRPHTRPNERKPFKCGRCRAFVGTTVSGGRHRNHCPLCLTSRHVDLRRPGDRLSPCRALMPAIGVAYRPDGEQMVVHRCNGCGIERRNRVAADDNPLALLRLHPVSVGKDSWVAEEEAIA